MLVLEMAVAKSQTIHFKHLDMEDGLSSNQVYDICRDHFGFLILATEQGLNKYDGRDVTLIKYKGNDDFEKLRFSSVLKTKSDVIWIGSSKGLYTLNKNRNIEKIKFGKDDISIRKILNYNDSIILSTNHGWYICHYQSKKPVPLNRLNRLLKGKNLSDLSIIDNRYLLGVSSEKSVCKADIDKGSLVFEVPIEIINTATQLKNGLIACGAGTGYIFILDGMTGKVIKQFESIKRLNNTTIHNSINHIREIGENRLAYTSEDDGFAVLDLATSQEKHYTQNIFDVNGLSSNQSVKILSDDSNNFFVTSLYGGIDFFNLNRYFIEKKELFFDQNKNTFKSYINSIAEDQYGKLWMGTTDRVIEFTPKTSETKYHYHHEVLGNLTVKVNALLGFKTLCIDKKGKIWKGSFKGGIVVFDPKTNKEIKLTKHEHQGGLSLLPASYIWHIMQDSKGLIWAATNYGFVKINPENYAVDTFQNTSVLKRIPRRRAKFVHEDVMGRIWLGTHYNGVYRYDEMKNELVNFDKGTGFENHCYNIDSDKKGNVFIAHENGFSVIDKNDKIENFTTENGLRNRMVEDFLFDEDDKAFIANHNTIIKFDFDTKQFKYFDEYLGIGRNSFRSNSAVKTNDGKMLWGTELGYISFDPKKLESIYKLPKLTIHDIYGSNKNHFTGDKISIHTDEAITFEFTSIDLFGSKNITYQYKLHDLYQAWIDLGTENKITFSSLPTGNYTFHVRATVNGIDWIVAEQLPSLSVSEPLHKNPKLYLSLLLLILIAMSMWIFQKQKSKNKEAIYRQQLAELEVKAIRAQMNPHFVFNALNSIQFFTYNGDVEKANEYLSDFAKLMRLVLQQSKDGNINLENEIELLKLYLKIEALRFDDDFIYDVKSEESINELEDIIIPSMIVQPFVENAIKHGLAHKKGHKYLSVVFSQEGDFIIIKVYDNGIGIEASKMLKNKSLMNVPHQSMGMELVRKRLDIYHASNTLKSEIIVNDSPNEGGTLITIRIPL